jgi:hypothetical protein
MTELGQAQRLFFNCQNRVAYTYGKLRHGRGPFRHTVVFDSGGRIVYEKRSWLQRLLRSSQNAS